MYLPCQCTILGVMLGAPLTRGTMQGRLSSSMSPGLSYLIKAGVTLLTVNSPLNHSDLLLDDKTLTAQKANGLCNIQIDSMINGSDFPDRGQVSVNILPVNKHYK